MFTCTRAVLGLGSQASRRLGGTTGVVHVVLEGAAEITRAVQAWGGLAQAAAAGAVDLERRLFHAIPPVCPCRQLRLAPQLRCCYDSDLRACSPRLLDWP